MTRKRLVVVGVLFALFALFAGACGDGGGEEEDALDEAIATRQWRPMPPSPLIPRSASLAWTGKEMLVWGGYNCKANPCNQGVNQEPLGDGAAYDPSTNQWRILALSPLRPRAGATIRWTGTELIVWGTSIRVDERPRDGAAYDPATDTWRKIADAPIELTDATAVWTGTEMIAFGAALHGGNQAETRHATGAVYDVASDSWRTLPPSGLSPQASTAAWDGHEMIAWDYEHGVAAYSPQTHEWRALPSPPLDFYECGPHAVAVSGRVFGNYCGAMVVYDRGTDGWRDVTRDDLLAWGFTLVPAPPAVFLIGRNVDTEDERMLAYRPD